MDDSFQHCFDPFLKQLKSHLHFIILKGKLHQASNCWSHGKQSQKKCLRLSFITLTGTAWKVSKYEVFYEKYFAVFGMNTEIYGKSPYSLRIQENTDQKISVFGHFSRSAVYHFLNNLFCYLVCGSLLKFYFLFQRHTRILDLYRPQN